MKLKWLATTTILAAIWIGLTQISLAQSTNSGDIRGVVTDTSGAPIPGAAVTILNIATGVSKDLTTNDSGVYDTSSIVAGTYKITFSKAGFSTIVRSAITVTVENIQVNAELPVGAVTQEVVVNTDVSLLKTENGERPRHFLPKDFKNCLKSDRIGQASTFLGPGVQVFLLVRKEPSARAPRTAPRWL